MKKIIAMLLALSLVFCLAACTTTPETPDNKPAEEGFSITYNGTKIGLDYLMADVLVGLGEAVTYTESPSCAFDGLDKTYGYQSLNIQTYTRDGEDYVYCFWFVDDLHNDAKTAEGICIGSAKADVDAAYGSENYNGTNAYQISKGKGQLTIILENDLVSSIQYVLLTN